MNVEILDAPLHFRLYGKSSLVENERYGETGLKLMDEMWKVVRQAGAANAGINHWVYLADGRMFVGVELLANAQPPAGLESLEFELHRYLKHLHVGPYQELPAKWRALKDDLAARGETIGAPSLEVYGHHCDDPAKTETTILIGLQG
jgi:hypothetical protein